MLEVFRAVHMMQQFDRSWVCVRFDATCYMAF